MDKLSDKMKKDIEFFDRRDVQSQLVKNTINKYLPEIEQLENDKEELIKMSISFQTTYDVLEEIFKYNHISIWSVIKGAFYGTYDFKNKIEKLTGKSWDQITKEQE